MSRVRHSTPYDKLAIEAGRREGMADPTPDCVSSNDAARAARDALWEEYEIRLTDTNTYTLNDLLAWLGAQGVKTGRSSVHRDRTAILCHENTAALAAAQTKAIIESVGEQAEGDIFASGRVLAGQLIFNALLNLDPEALANMTAPQILKMADVLGRLSKSHAETEMIAARLAQLRKQFDDQVEKAAAKTGDGSLSKADIVEIRKAVFGEAA